MSARAVETELANRLKRKKEYTVRRSIDARSKVIPFILVNTSSIDPLHPGSSLQIYTIEVSLFGPQASPDDENNGAEVHTLMHKELGEAINGILENDILAGRWTLSNCVETIPTIAQINDNEYWQSGYELTFQ